MRRHFQFFCYSHQLCFIVLFFTCVAAPALQHKEKQSCVKKQRETLIKCFSFIDMPLEDGSDVWNNQFFDTNTVTYPLMGLVWLIRSGSLLFLVSGSKMLIVPARMPQAPKIIKGRVFICTPANRIKAYKFDCNHKISLER